uniref:Uncharacterized protein n=1 Tax=Fundulus heteroclitus TaxID=8078 RepID=A0A3Q2T4I5_FUNHE
MKLSFNLQYTFVRWSISVVGENINLLVQARYENHNCVEWRPKGENRTCRQRLGTCVRLTCYEFLCFFFFSR